MYRFNESLLLAEKKKDYEKAIFQAQEEIKLRNTPETQDLLAWVYFLKGDFQKALDITNTKVYTHTYEPMTLYHIARIYGHFKEKHIMLSLKRELSSIEIEMGPLMRRKIKELN